MISHALCLRLLLGIVGASESSVPGQAELLRQELSARVSQGDREALEEALEVRRALVRWILRHSRLLSAIGTVQVSASPWSERAPLLSRHLADHLGIVTLNQVWERPLMPDVLSRVLAASDAAGASPLARLKDTAHAVAATVLAHAESILDESELSPEEEERLWSLMDRVEATIDALEELSPRGSQPTPTPHSEQLPSAQLRAELDRIHDLVFLLVKGAEGTDWRAEADPWQPLLEAVEPRDDSVLEETSSGWWFSVAETIRKARTSQDMTPLAEWGSLLDQDLQQACRTLTDLTMLLVRVSNLPISDQERLSMIREAGGAAQYANRPQYQEQLQFFEARELRRQGRFREALDQVRQSVAGLSPESPLRWNFAELEARLLGERTPRRESWRRLQELLEELPVEDQFAELRWSVECALHRIHMHLGLPELAAEWILADAEVRRQLDPTPALATRIHRSRLAEIRLAGITGRYQDVVSLADEFLAAPIFETPSPQNRAHFRHLRAKAHRHLFRETEDSTHLEQAFRDLESALEDGPPYPVDLEARLFLAHLHASQGRWDSAQALVQEIDRRRQARKNAELPLRLEAGICALRSAVARHLAPQADELRSLQLELEDLVSRSSPLWDDLPLRRGGIALLLSELPRTVQDEWVRLCLNLDPEGGAERALRAVFEQQSRGTLARFLDAPIPTIQELRNRWVTQDQGVLILVPGAPQVHGFLLSQHKIEWVELGDAERVAELQQQYCQLLQLGLPSSEEASPRVSQERRMATALSRTLLPEPIAKRLRSWTHLTVIGHESLGPPSFAWLPLGDSQFLIDRMSITYLPSAPIAAALERRRPQGPRSYRQDLLLCGAAIPTESVQSQWPSVGPLTIAPKKLEQIMSSYGDRTQRLVGSELQWEQLAAFPLSETRCLQFLTHGVVDYRREHPGGIPLSEGSTQRNVLWSEDVLELSSPPLVLLTTCRSGASVPRLGDPGTTSMAGTWMERGAETVLVSHTDLTLQVALDLSTEFHRVLRRGTSPAAALQQSIAVVSNENRETAPFRCGILELSGLGHFPLFTATPDSGASPGSPTKTLGWWVAAAALTLGGAMFVGWRRKLRSTVP